MISRACGNPEMYNATLRTYSLETGLFGSYDVQ